MTLGDNGGSEVDMFLLDAGESEATGGGGTISGETGGPESARSSSTSAISLRTLECKCSEQTMVIERSHLHVVVFCRQL